jgi:hypothetical protein
MIVAMGQTSSRPCLTGTGAPRLPSTQADAASLTPAVSRPSRVQTARRPAHLRWHPFLNAMTVGQTDKGQASWISERLN